MASSTITLRIPEAEKREASRILRARGTTLTRRLRAFVREIIDDEEDAADLALAQERMKNLNVKDCMPMDEFMREVGVTQDDLDNAPDDEIV